MDSTKLCKNTDGSAFHAFTSSDSSCCTFFCWGRVRKCRRKSSQTVSNKYRSDLHYSHFIVLVGLLWNAGVLTSFFDKVRCLSLYHHFMAKKPFLHCFFSNCSNNSDEIIRINVISMMKFDLFLIQKAVFQVLFVNCSI